MYFFIGNWADFAYFAKLSTDKYSWISFILFGIVAAQNAMQKFSTQFTCIIHLDLDNLISDCPFHLPYLTPIQINGGSTWRARTITELGGAWQNIWSCHYYRSPNRRSKFDCNYCYNQYSGSNKQNNGYCSWCLSFLHSNSGCKWIRYEARVTFNWKDVLDFRWFYFANMTTTQFAWSIAFPTVYINNVKKITMD